VLAAGAGRRARVTFGGAPRGDVVGLDGVDALLASGGKQRPTAGPATCAGPCRPGVAARAVRRGWHDTAWHGGVAAATSKLAVAAMSS